jgi:uncharacterized protein YbbC (DUF1343 family)
MFVSKYIKTIFLLFLLPFFSVVEAQVVGADRTELYMPLLKGKRVALVVNQTSTIGKVHLLDTLIKRGVVVKKVFAPEHGFRGNMDAGAKVGRSVDKKTGIPLVSIYGKNKKPSLQMMRDVDVVVFDIQDVGARFYTYISTLHYVMESCAENHVPLIVLDRPNPNDYIDGPMLNSHFRSFVGMDKIPLLHGCTIGELARMINGEHWLKNGDTCKLIVVKMKDWKHGDFYHLPIKPSPNLPNDDAIRLYPSLCLFEGTVVSVGRGTLMPFQVVGYPDERFGSFAFKPEPIKGMETKPLQQGQECYGIDLRGDKSTKGFSLTYLLKFYTLSGKGELFFTNASFFDKLAGTNVLREQILEGLSESQIRQSWQADLDGYKQMRKKYLLYAE